MLLPADLLRIRYHTFTTLLYTLRYVVVRSRVIFVIVTVVITLRCNLIHVVTFIAIAIVVYSRYRSILIVTGVVDFGGDSTFVTLIPDWWRPATFHTTYNSHIYFYTTVSRTTICHYTSRVIAVVIHRLILRCCW